MRHAANQRRRRPDGPPAVHSRPPGTLSTAPRHRPRRRRRPGTVAAMRTPLPSPIRVHGAVPSVVVVLLLVALLSLARPAGALGAPVDPVPVGVWPLQPQPEVVRAFDPPDDALRRRVTAASTSPARVGQPVLAALAGRVTLRRRRWPGAASWSSTTARPARRTSRSPRPSASGQPVLRGQRSAPSSSGAPTASRAPACTGAGGAATPTSTRCCSSAAGRSGCSRCGRRDPVPRAPAWRSPARRSGAAARRPGVARRAVRRLPGPVGDGPAA